MREHTAQMQLPRFLWVPFELGRPFGAPHEPDFQRRVLHDALRLLEREDGPVLLEDFRDEAPSAAPGEEAPWSCPVTFHPPSAGEPAWVREVLDEMARLAPWHELYVEGRGRAAPAASGLAPEQVVRALGELAEGVAEPQVPTPLPLPEWLRLGCDELRTWYLEAAQGRPGRASSRALGEWFWRETALARLIGLAAGRLARSADPSLSMLGRRALVPRVHMGQLVPGVEPFI